MVRWYEAKASHSWVSHGLWRTRSCRTKTEKGAAVWFSDTQIVVKI